GEDLRRRRAGIFLCGLSGGLGARFELVCFAPLVGSSRGGLAELRRRLVEVLLSLCNGLLMAVEEFLLRLVASRGEFDAEVGARPPDLVGECLAGGLDLRLELCAGIGQLMAQLGLALLDLASKIGAALLD